MWIELALLIILIIILLIFAAGAATRTNESVRKSLKCKRDKHKLLKEKYHGEPHINNRYHYETHLMEDIATNIETPRISIPQTSALNDIVIDGESVAQTVNNFDSDEFVMSLGLLDQIPEDLLTFMIASKALMDKYEAIDATFGPDGDITILSNIDRTIEVLINGREPYVRRPGDGDDKQTSTIHLSVGDFVSISPRPNTPLFPSDGFTPLSHSGNSSDIVFISREANTRWEADGFYPLITSLIMPALGAGFKVYPHIYPTSGTELGMVMTALPTTPVSSLYTRDVPISSIASTSPMVSLPGSTSGKVMVADIELTFSLPTRRMKYSSEMAYYFSFLVGNGTYNVVPSPFLSDGEQFIN